MAVAKGDNKALHLRDGTEIDPKAVKKYVNGCVAIDKQMASLKADKRDLLDKAKDAGFKKKHIKLAAERMGRTAEERAEDYDTMMVFDIALGLMERDVIGELVQSAGSKPPESPSDGDGSSNGRGNFD